jgi:hypothetical protein
MQFATARCAWLHAADSWLLVVIWTVDARLCWSLNVTLWFTIYHPYGTVACCAVDSCVTLLILTCKSKLSLQLTPPSASGHSTGGTTTSSIQPLYVMQRKYRPRLCNAKVQLASHQSSRLLMLVNHAPAKLLQIMCCVHSQARDCAAV